MCVDEAGEEEAVIKYFDDFGVLPFWLLTDEGVRGLYVLFDKGDNAVLVDSYGAVFANLKFGERLAVYKGSKVDRF